MEKRKYNLRSTRNDDLQIPVQLQFSDNNVLTNLLGFNDIGGTQGDFNSSSLESELDFGGIVEHSDSDDSGTQTRSFNRLHLDNPTTSTHTTAALSPDSMITQKVLDQLQLIGSRSDYVNWVRIFPVLPYMF